MSDNEAGDLYLMAKQLILSQTEEDDQILDADHAHQYWSKVAELYLVALGELQKLKPDIEKPSTRSPPPDERLPRTLLRRATVLDSKALARSRAPRRGEKRTH